MRALSAKLRHGVQKTPLGSAYEGGYTITAVNAITRVNIVIYRSF